MKSLVFFLGLVVFGGPALAGSRYFHVTEFIAKVDEFTNKDNCMFRLEDLPEGATPIGFKVEGEVEIDGSKKAFSEVRDCIIHEDPDSLSPAHQRTIFPMFRIDQNVYSSKRTYFGLEGGYADEFVELGVIDDADYLRFHQSIEGYVTYNWYTEPWQVVIWELMQGRLPFPIQSGTFELDFRIKD